MQITSDSFGLCGMQALLEGISLSQPQPKIPSELIKFLGKTYNAWHIAIPLLESHVMLFPTVRPDIPPDTPQTFELLAILSSRGAPNTLCPG